MGQTHPPIIIVSGTVGSGKGTIVHALTHELGLTWVPTHTTRAHRIDDDVLSNRIFDTEPTFLRHLARHEFVETIERGADRYGLLRADIDQAIKKNKPAIIELSVEGGIKIASLYSRVLLIFIYSQETIQTSRISQRYSNHSEQAVALKQTKLEQRRAKEQYDYLVGNVEHHPEEAIDAIKQIILRHFPELNTKGTV